MRRNQALTFVELLVVLAIITFLAGLLVPVLMASKGKANTSVLAVQGKEIAVALLQYAEDSDGHWPEHGLDILVSTGHLTSREILSTKGDDFKEGYAEHILTCMDVGHHVKIPYPVSWESLFLRQGNDGFASRLAHFEHGNEENPGILVNRTLGERNPVYLAALGCGADMYYYIGTYVRMRMDTSAVTRRAVMEEGHDKYGVTRTFYNFALFSDLPTFRSRS